MCEKQVTYFFSWDKLLSKEISHLFNKKISHLFFNVTKLCLVGIVLRLFKEWDLLSICYLQNTLFQLICQNCIYFCTVNTASWAEPWLKAVSFKYPPSKTILPFMTLKKHRADDCIDWWMLHSIIYQSIENSRIN